MIKKPEFKDSVTPESKHRFLETIITNPNYNYNGLDIKESSLQLIGIMLEKILQTNTEILVEMKKMNASKARKHLP